MIPLNLENYNKEKHGKNITELNNLLRKNNTDYIKDKLDYIDDCEFIKIIDTYLKPYPKQIRDLVPINLLKNNLGIF